MFPPQALPPVKSSSSVAGISEEGFEKIKALKEKIEENEAKNVAQHRVSPTHTSGSEKILSCSQACACIRVLTCLGS